jgi:hypothetical protein
MTIYHIRSVLDIENLKEDIKEYVNIVIYAEKIKEQGVLRYAFKYATWHLKLGGRLDVIISPALTFKFLTNKIEFWQVSNELYKAVAQDFKVIEHTPKKGKIVLVKMAERYKNNGVSFCIVFSGNKSEETLLIKSIESIANNDSLESLNFEILVCGPSSYSFKRIASMFSNDGLKYIPYDIEVNPRLLITEKKNYIFSVAKFNIVVMSHTRIIFSSVFAKAIVSKKFDVCTVKINVNNSGRLVSYLDLGLIGHYDLSKTNSYKPLIGEYLLCSPLYLMKNRVPYIDGGLTILNKSIVEDRPYNEMIAWGEAEDVDLCAKLYFSGCLIDRFEDIKCVSSVSKVKVVARLKLLLFRLYLKVFIMKGWG